MKKIIGFLLLGAILLSGCSNETEMKKERSEASPEEEGVPVVIENAFEETAPEKDSTVETYDDQTQNEIVFGKLAFTLEYYHITSSVSSHNEIVLNCERNEGETWPPKSQLSISIKQIQAQVFNRPEDVERFMKDQFPEYETIKIYRKIEDASGITDLYIATTGETTHYFIYSDDSCYKMEANDNALENRIFSELQTVNYMASSKDIKDQDNLIAIVQSDIDYDTYCSEYTIEQMKADTEQSVHIYPVGDDVNKNEYDGNAYDVVVTDEYDDPMLEVSIEALEIMSIIKVSDENNDGYADLQIISESGAQNNVYELYLWNDLKKSYEKIEGEKPIS